MKFSIFNFQFSINLIIKQVINFVLIFFFLLGNFSPYVFAQTATDSSNLNQASSSAQTNNTATQSSSSLFDDSFLNSSVVPQTGFTGPSASSLFPSFDAPNSQPIANITPINTRWTIAGNTKHDFKGDGTYQVNINDISPQNLQSEVFDANGKAVSVNFNKIATVNGTSIQILPPKNFKPGKYTLKVTDSTGNTQTQDFTWGVLAINTNKSIFLPNETATIAMAVLNDTGAMVCDADVELRITNQELGINDILSTTNGKIKVNPECQIHNYTQKPDYQANYQTLTAGTYNMTLTASISNGIKTITDSFQVQNSVPFDVERQTGTRIFPPATYPVNFNIKVNQDFKGQIIEYVPNSFKIYPSTNSAASVFDVKQIATPVKNENGTLSSLRILLPFNGTYNQTLGFSQHLLDPFEKDLYARFGLLGHDGLDFEMPIGTSVLAADNGTVVMAGGEIYGTTVVVQHSWGRSYYGHLSKVNVTLGQTISKGQEIALSGNTGITTGPHLHFSIKLNSNDPANGFYGKIDPSLYLGIQNQPQITAVNINDTVKAIVFDVDVKKGDTLNLSYAFVAPSVSPQFYTLGPLSFVENNQVVFQEARLWQIAADVLDVSNGDGILFYAAASNTTPQWRTYDNATNDFSANSGTVAGAQPAINQIKTSPTKQEAIAGYQDTSGNLRVLCYDGTSWTEDWTVAVAASGTPTTRRFDIAYETNTGNVTVAYSRNTAAVNALAYRTKAGSTGCGSANWASAANFPTTTTATSATVMWVKAVRDGRSAQNLSAWVWLDNASTNADLGGAIWSGSAFTNFKSIETSMEHQSAVGDSDNFDVQYESLSGDLMVVWGNSAGASGTNGYRYMTCTGGTSSCTWSALLTMPTTLDEVMMIDLSADPLSNKMAMAGIGGASFDMSAGYWDGTGPWIGYANVDSTTETTVSVGSKKVTTGWLTNGANTKWYISYDDHTGTGISYKYTINGGTITTPGDYTSTPAVTDLKGRYDTDVNPFNTAELIQTVSDDTNGIFAYKLTMDASGNLAWSDMASVASLGTKPSHPQQGFSYTYWRFIPVPTFSQSAYRLFNNADSTDVGTTLAGQDTAGSLTATGNAFRLRLLLHVGANRSGTTPAFKLQFAAQSGTCDTSFTGETYADVTGATVIAYKNNATPVDEDALTVNANDPQHSTDTTVPETYQELNNFSPVTSIPSAQDGMWDFVLFDNGAPATTAYCFRVLTSAGSVIDGYTVIPQITTAAAVTGPTLDQLLRHGAWFNAGVEQPFTF